MKLSEKRTLFTSQLTELVRYIEECGYSCYYGDGKCTVGHRKGSFHYKGLAQDINLFKNGKYLRTTEAHAMFGKYWKELDPKNTWGGDWRKKDGNHYSRGEQ